MTRSVSLKSAEAQRKEGEAAIKKELDGLRYVLGKLGTRIILWRWMTFTRTSAIPTP